MSRTRVTSCAFPAYTDKRVVASTVNLILICLPSTTSTLSEHYFILHFHPRDTRRTFLLRFEGFQP